MRGILAFAFPPQAALQRELGLPVDPNIPLFGFIGRLDYQKGVDLIRDNYDWLMGERVQLVLLGSGMQELEQSLRDMENKVRGMSLNLKPSFWRLSASKLNLTEQESVP